MGEHVSVLLKESINLLNVKGNGIYVDLTLGRGGHSAAILSKLDTGHLYSFDLDNEAIDESRNKLASISDKFTLIHANFATAKEKLSELGINKIDGIIMDLGVSSPQFDEKERGFSYRYDGPLDMRMDKNAKLSAKEIVNTYCYEDLVRIFFKYGEDKDSKLVAKAIIKSRDVAPINTTLQLVDIICKSKSKRSLNEKGHPAKQIFQALRIETNKELDNLEQALIDMPTLLKDGGRMVVITFHSLEDRLVKDAFRNLTERKGSRYGPQSIMLDDEPNYISLTKHIIVPSNEEIETNHRAKSAKCRAIERKENQNGR